MLLGLIKRYAIKALFGLIAALAVLLAGLRIAGLVPYIVTSGSMSPTFAAGSLIYVKAAAPEEIQVGDPITYRLESSVVTHRVVGIDAENRLFYTKGDANEEADFSPVSFGRLIGKPALHIPLLGYFSYYVATPFGLFILIGVGLFVLALRLFSDKDKAPEGKSAGEGQGGEAADTSSQV